MCVLLCATGACTSLAGAPRRIVPVKSTLAIAAKYPIDVALINYEATDDASRGGLSKQQYRDLVVAIYLNAVDARYSEFRAALSGEARGAGLGFDLAVLGLTTGASVAKKSIVNELSAVAAAFAGSKIAIDRNLYFEKAVPALLAAMDAERYRVKTAIVTSLRKSSTDYPLQVAFGEIAEYELAGSIDRAVDQVTSTASAERAEAKAAYQDAVLACDSADDRIDNVNRITVFVRSLVTAGDTAGLQALATLMGLDAIGTPADIRERVRNDLLSQYCTNEKLESLIGDIGVQPWGGAI